MNRGYGYHPPAQAVMILGGPYLDEDGVDNPKYDANNQLLCDLSINGLNFGDTIADNERLGMTGFIYMHNYGPAYSTDPHNPIDYYNYLKMHWRDGSKLLYGGWNGHVSTGSLGPECNFMFPGDSDPCNWGTYGILPNGGYNQNGLFWTENQVGNMPQDRRGLGVSGPFTFEPGDVHELDLAFVWARDYDGTPVSSAELLEEYCAAIKERFENDEDFFSAIASNPKSEITGIRVYPNPLRNELNLELNAIVDQGNVAIYNMKGEVLIKTSFAHKRNLKIKTRQLPEGLYIVKLFDGTLNHVSKFVKK
ncbi:MAG: T9SS type A sorting domain-containing protein [Bacteroidales bacterium]